MKDPRKIFFTIVFFTLLAVIFSFPLVTKFNSAIPYAYSPSPVYSSEQLVPGDHLQLYYTYWMLKDFFQTPGQHFLEDPYMFSAAGLPRPYDPKELPSSVLFLLFSFLGNVAAYNCMLILSFLLSGLFTYLLARKYFNNNLAALTAGTIFALSPFRLNQLFGGHPTGLVLFWIPLIVFLYELLWEKRKWIFGWLSAVCTIFMGMEEHHMGYYMALFTVVFWLYKYIFCNKEERLTFFQFTLLLIPVAVGWIGSFGYMMYVKMVVISSSITEGGRQFNEIKLFSPQIRHIFQRVNPDGEKCIYLGVISYVLISIGLFRKSFLSIKKHLAEDSFPFFFYFIAFVVTLLLSLGPSFYYFPLYKMCYKVIPFFYFPRATARIFMLTLLAGSMLAGYGIKALTESAQKKAFASFITIFSIILICLDFHIFPKVGLCKFNSGNRTYDYIVKSAPNDPLLEIPLWPGESSWSTVYQYYTTIYRVPIVNGYSPFVTKKYIDKIFWPLVSINMGMINEDQYKLLKSLGIKYINMHEEAYPYKVSPFPFKTALKNMEQSPYVKFIIQDGPIYLFQILDPPLTNIAQNIYTIPAKTGVFYECENMPHRFGQNVVDKSASNNLALHADTLPSDDTRHFIFGPWQMFPPGKYTMLFRMKINPRNTENKTDDKLAAIEITTENGNSRIAYKDITLNDCAADYKDYSIDFTLDKLAVLEFRVLYLGECYISADYIYLTTADTKDPICSYKAEDLFHTGREKDGAAFVDPTLDPGGNFVFGPYRRYPEGKYKIGYSIKSGRPSPDNSAVISVVTGHGTIPLAKMELSNIPAEYKAYWLEIELDKPTVLEFKVDFLKVVPIYFKSVEVKNE